MYLRMYELCVCRYMHIHSTIQRVEKKNGRLAAYRSHGFFHRFHVTEAILTIDGTRMFLEILASSLISRDQMLISLCRSHKHQILFVLSRSHQR
jgi:hypothetical protein